MKKNTPLTAEYIAQGADDRLKPEARELAEQVFFMRKKLEEMREELKDEPLVTEYDNGGQQRGTHVNPVFKAHRDLVLTYAKTLKALEDIIGKEDPNENEGTLEELRTAYNLNFSKANGTEGDKVKSLWKK